jgi:hypothetical protein
MVKTQSGITVTEYHYRRDLCRLCQSKHLDLVIPMRPLPIASPNIGKIEETAAYVSAPADIYICRDCELLQLCDVINPELQYLTFRYTTTVSVGLPEHFKDLADTLASNYAQDTKGLLLEIGSNDGTFLKAMQERGFDVLGIDPAKDIAKKASENGIPTLAQFFNAELAREIAQDYGPVDIIVSSNTIANLDNMDDLMKGVKEIAHDNTVFIIETQYGLDVLEKTLLDVVYHEHLSYFTLKPIAAFFARYGFKVINAEKISPKGGSIRISATSEDSNYRVSDNVEALMKLEKNADFGDNLIFNAFNSRIGSIRDQIKTKACAVKQKGGIVAVYGASVGCASLLQQFDLSDIIDVVFDDNAFHDRMPGLERNVPIKSGETIPSIQPDLILILAWRYSKNILNNHRHRIPDTCEVFQVLPEFCKLPLNET